MLKTNRTRPWSSAALALIAILPHGSAQVCSAERLADGTTRVAGAGTIRSYDKDHKEQWVLSGKEMGINPGILAGMSLLPDGSLVIANWGCKGDKAADASALAIGPDRRVLWRLNHPAISSAAHVQVLPEETK